MVIFLIVWFGLIAVASVVALALKNKAGANSRSNVSNSKIKKKRFAEYVQSFYKKTPFIKEIYSKTFNRLQAIYPSEITEIHKKTTETITKTLLIAFAVVAVGVLTSGGSVIYIGAFIICAYIVMSLYIDTYLEAMERKLLKGFYNVIPQIGKEYEKAKILEVAIYNVFLKISSENSFKKRSGIMGMIAPKKKLVTSGNAIIGLHLQQIHKVLTAPKASFEVEMAKYVESAPNQFLTMFLSICKTIKKNGDAGLSNGEGSSFKKRLYELQELISDEIINTEKLYYGMRATPFIALGGLLFIQPFKMFSQFALPETEDFFKTSFWNWLVVIVFGVSIIVHKYIMTIKSPFVNKPVTKSIWYKILQGEPILNIPRWMPNLREKYIEYKHRKGANNIINRKLNEYQSKKYSKCELINRRLKASGENISVKMFLLKKCTFFVCGFVATLILCCTGVVRDKIQAIPNYTQAFEEALAPSDSYKELMSTVAEDLARQSGRKCEEAKTITEMVLEDGRVNRVDMAEVIANEMATQNATYNSKYFKWYYLLTSLAIGVILFYVPDVFLKKRMQMASLIKEDEVNQYRAIISLHMDNGSTTVRTILYDMQKFAQYYREPISKCIIQMDTNTAKALRELKSADTEDSTFANIVDGLINVSVAGVQKAFESIKIEKASYRENRKLEVERINKSKISLAEKICFIPAYTTIVMTLFVPLGLKAFAMFNQIGLK